MKIRRGFVSNSSSSSFIVTNDNEVIVNQFATEREARNFINFHRNERLQLHEGIIEEEIQVRHACKAMSKGGKDDNDNVVTEMDMAAV